MNPSEISIDSIGPEGRWINLAMAPDAVRRELRNRGAEDVSPSGPLTAALRLIREGDEVGLSGEIAGEIERSCVRCLDVFPVKIDSKFSIKLVRGGARSGMEGHAELELKASDLDVETFDGEHIDLAGAVFDQLILSLPEYPQCREDCKGLCPDCGAELNRGPCGCGDKKPVDPRLAALLKLKRPAG